MEVEEETVHVTFQLSVANFSSYTAEQQVSSITSARQQGNVSTTELTCSKTISVSGTRATFNITLDLFDKHTPNKRPTTSTGGGRFNQITPSKASVKFSGADSKESSPAKISSRVSSESRFKKSSLKELYTYGGIEEVIYTQGDTNILSPKNGYSPFEKKFPKSRNYSATPSPDRWSSTDAGEPYNVGIRVTCIHSSLPWQMLQHIQIQTGIQDRPEQLRSLSLAPFVGRTASDGPVALRLAYWTGILVPRISIKTYGLLQKGVLNAWITFSIPREIMSVQPRDSIQELSWDMKRLLESAHTSADALIITSEGDQLPVHLAILRARSSLLTSSRIMGESKYDIGIMVDGRSPAATKLKVGSNNIATKPSEKTRYPPSTNDEDSASSSFESVWNIYAESDDEEAQFRSPETANLNYLNRQANVIRTPSKQQIPANLRSPSRTASSDRLKKNPRQPLVQLHLNSPSKKNKKNITKLDDLAIEDHEVVRDLNQCFIECNDTNLSMGTTLNSKPDKDHVTNFMEDLKENFDNLHMKRNSYETDNSLATSDKVLIKVNMSTSVTKQFLEWIYTGDCSHLSALCRPLLIAGRRHGVSALVSACERHLSASLTVATVPNTLLLAHTHQAWILLREALLFARDHAREVTATQDWERVVNDCPELAVKLSRVMTA